MVELGYCQKSINRDLWMKLDRLTIRLKLMIRELRVKFIVFQVVLGDAYPYKGVIFRKKRFLQ